MFGIGWTEMLLVGVVALIVIGPKDLPVVMTRLGKMVSSIRRMGSEFQREINKATGLDAVTDLRKTITEPLRQTAADIRKEFNKPLASGAVVPSGVIAPKDPEAESVVDEIHEKIGMPAAQPYVPFTKEAQEKYRAEQAGAPVMEPLKRVESPAPAEAIAPAKKPRAPRKPKVSAEAKPAAPAVKRAPAMAKAASAPVVDLLDGLPPVKTAKPRKPRAAKPKTEA